MEGCAEHRILRLDKSIDRSVRRLWQRDDGADAHAHLATAQSTWQEYRAAACVSEADSFAGGSLAALTAAQCLLRLTRQRASDLAQQLRMSAGG